MIRFFTFLGGFYFFLEFLLPTEFFGFSFAPYHQSITNGVLTVGVMAVGLGLISILRVHGSRVLFGGSSKEAGRLHSLLLIGAMVLMMVVTSREALLDARDARLAERGSILREFAGKIVAEGAVGSQGMPQEQRVQILVSAAHDFLRELPDYATAQLGTEASRNDLAGAVKGLEGNLALQRDDSSTANVTAYVSSLGDGLGGVTNALRAHQSAVREHSSNRALYQLLFQGLWVALSAAMFSLLGFYIASAAFRAFRIRSVESALMMFSSVIVMLGQIPFGVWISESLPGIRSWLLSVPSSAAFRAIRIGSGIAGLLMAIRMWLSLDLVRSSKSGGGGRSR